MEIHSQVRCDQKWQLVSLVNLSGQYGRALLDPVPVKGARQRMRSRIQMKSAHAFIAQQACAVTVLSVGQVEISLADLSV